jgi:putative FmdB family regulatory protein
MPTYGYECLSCHNQIEVFQSIKDDPLTSCETCGGTLRKRIYPVGIAFKGSGFYVNDYANSGAKSEAKPEPAAESKTEVKAETAKPDSPKAEAKSEAPAAV